jgi:hypothetical protein
VLNVETSNAEIAKSAKRYRDAGYAIPLFIYVLSEALQGLFISEMREMFFLTRRDRWLAECPH